MKEDCRSKASLSYRVSSSHSGQLSEIFVSKLKGGRGGGVDRYEVVQHIKHLSCEPHGLNSVLRTHIKGELTP